MRNEKGFSLTELMTVVSIIGILTAIVVPSYRSYMIDARAKACRANLEIINSAAREWVLDNPGTAVSHNLTVSELDDYIDSDFDSLECPSDGIYYTDADNDNVPDPTEVVLTLTSTGAIPAGSGENPPNTPPEPNCSKYNKNDSAFNTHRLGVD